MKTETFIVRCGNLTYTEKDIDDLARLAADLESAARALGAIYALDDEVTFLRTENERLRAALEEIKAGYHTHIQECMNIAKAALEEKK